MRLLGNGTLSGSYDDDCPITRETLTRLGDKWSVLVMSILAKGPMRFNALKRSIDGISQRVLTSTLRALERDGLVNRSVFPANPPNVDYSLRPLGQTLLGAVSGLARWAEAYGAELVRARNASASTPNVVVSETSDRASSTSTPTVDRPPPDEVGR